MPVTKEMFNEQYGKARARVLQLRKMGKTEPEIEETMAKEGYYVSVLSKIFHKSGKCITKKVKAEDVKLAKQTFTERQDIRKPIRQKEIEDAAWFHNLTHDLGKYVFHKIVRYVPWTDEDMNNYEHARKTLTGFIDGVTPLIEDSDKVQRLENEKTLWEKRVLELQHDRDVAVNQVKSLAWLNKILIGNMTPESQLRALSQIALATAMKTMPESENQDRVETD